MRVGIIGVGWGSAVQVPAFRAVEGYEVVALCSRRADRVAAAAAKLGVAETSTDWTTFVQRDDLDVVSICTPVDLHLEQTVAATAARKHVLVEKPVGLTAVQTGLMLAAADEAGVCHAVCFESRHEPSRLAVSDLVAGGHLGTPYLAMARAGGAFWHPSHALQSEWMYRRDAGGGYLMGLGSHDVDYLCSLFGDPVEVSADVRTSVSFRMHEDGSVLTIDADDTAVLLMRMANGLLASVTSTAIALGESFRALELFGSGGSLVLDGPLISDDSVSLRASKPDERAHEVAPRVRPLASGAEITGGLAGPITALALMLEDWLPAFTGQPAPGVPTLADGHRVQQVVDAARRSSDGDGWVKLA